jgi:hypothetical protein
LNAVSVFTRYVSDTKPLQELKQFKRTKMNKTSFTYFYHFRYFSAHAQFSLHLFPTSQEQIAANYKVLKTYPMALIKSKIWTFIFQRRKEIEIKNFTVILHMAITSVTNPGGKYIQPYLDKGMNVVNLNYRLKRGIPKRPKT